MHLRALYHWHIFDQKVPPVQAPFVRPAGPTRGVLRFRPCAEAPRGHRAGPRPAVTLVGVSQQVGYGPSARLLESTRQIRIPAVRAAALERAGRAPPATAPSCPATTCTPIRRTPTACSRRPRSSPRGVARRRRSRADRSRRGLPASPRPSTRRTRRGHHARLRLRALGELGRPHAFTSSRCSIDPANAALNAGLAAIRAGRTMRARRIGDGARRGRHPRRVRRRAEVRDQRASHHAHAFRALPGRSRPRARREGRVQALSRRRASPATSRTSGRR